MMKCGLNRKNIYEIPPCESHFLLIHFTSFTHIPLGARKQRLNHSHIMCLLFRLLRVNLEKKLKFPILPKNEQNTWKNYPDSSLDTFSKFFVRFLEELKIPKIAFEIYWPLVIVIMSLWLWNFKLQGSKLAQSYL